ncbi:MAG: ABC-2 family transporter protein [Clostridiales bacterium]|nr:ABC-2 family transporter protein [Clostridiales bacterium]
MRRYLRLYKLFVLQYLKTLMQSKLDLAIGIAGFVISQASGLVFILLVFTQIPEINGYGIDQMVFIYGFSLLPKGLDHLLTDCIWWIPGTFVTHGGLDKFLIRPLNVFFQIACEKFQADALGELAVGAALVSLSIARGAAELSVLDVMLFIVAVLAGTVIYTSVKLIAATFSFWYKNSFHIINTIYHLNDFAKYPISIYPKFIRIALTAIVPFAAASFYPASYFLDRSSLAGSIGIAAAAAAVSGSAAYGFFLLGLKSYDSSGN